MTEFADHRGGFVVRCGAVRCAWYAQVVVGHSLENDLRAMRMIHHRVADTALLFADDRGTSYKPSLRHLAERHLKIQIQQDSHDSETDAVTALRLLELKQRYGPDYGVQREDDGESLYLALQAAQRKTSVVGKSAALSRVDVPIGASDLVETTSDAEVPLVMPRLATRCVRGYLGSDA